MGSFAQWPEHGGVGPFLGVGCAMSRGEVGQAMRGGDDELAVSRTDDNKAAPTLSNGDNGRGDFHSKDDPECAR